MPLKKTMERAEHDKPEGKAPSTQAGEFVREEMHQLGRGKRAPRSRKQAVAIGLSKARQAGVDLPLREKNKQAQRGRKRKAEG